MQKIKRFSRTAVAGFDAGRFESINKVSSYPVIVPGSIKEIKMKEKVLLAARFYKCQEGAKTLYKDEYPARIKFYTDALQVVMKKENQDELHALLTVCEIPGIGSNGMAVMLFTAAAVELIENPTT